MSTTAVAEAPVAAAVRWKRIVLPPEHGAWGFLLEPIIVGLVVASTVPGWLAALSIIAAFLARNPLRIALADRRLGIRSERTRGAEMLAMALIAVAAAAFGIAIVSGDVRMMLPVAVALPFAMVQAQLERMRRSRALAAEICGTIAIGSAASVIAFSAGADALEAFPLWLLLSARSVPAVLYVRERIALEKRGVTPSLVPVTAHVVAILASAFLLPASAANIPAFALLVLLLFRCIVGLSPLRRPSSARTIGTGELIWGAAMVAAVIAGAPDLA